MKRQHNEIGRRVLSNSIAFLRQYWIGLACVALFGFAIMAPPAEAAPMPQLTVPTATPTAFEPPENNSNNDDDDDNNSSDAVFELFNTPTPEPLFEPEFEPDFGNDDEVLGGGGFGADSGGGAFDLESDDLLTDPATEEETPLFESEPLFEENEFEGLVDASFLNIFSGPDSGSGIIDTLFRDTPVQIIGRDASGEWVQICCGEERGNSGWVPASDIDFGFDFDLFETELPVFGEDPFLGENPDLNAPIGVEGILESGAEIAELELAMSVESANVRPGDEVELFFWVTNVSEVDAVDVSLRNELPPILEFDSANYLDASLTETINSRNNDAPVFQIDWPELAAGETMTATVFVQVSNDADYGLVVDNLAGVGAINAEIETAGITFGTPPVLPPDFRIFR